MADSDGYWPGRKTTHRPLKRRSSQTSHRSDRLPRTTTEEARAQQPYFQIPADVFEYGKFEKGFDRGIKLAKVKD